MRVVGYVLTVFGCLLVLSALNNGARLYDLSSRHDLSKFAGGLGFSILILVGGLAMLKKSAVADQIPASWSEASSCGVRVPPKSNAASQAAREFRGAWLAAFWFSVRI